MSAPLISETEIWSVCDALRATGKAPELITVSSVHDRLDNRGSRSTVSKGIKSWRSSLSENKAAPSLSDIDLDGLTKAIQAIVQRHLEPIEAARASDLRSFGERERELQIEVEAADAEAIQLEERLQKAEVNVQRLVSENKELKEEVERYFAAAAELRRTVQSAINSLVRDGSPTQDLAHQLTSSLEAYQLQRRLRKGSVGR